MGSPVNVDQSIIDKIIADKKVPIIAPLGLDKNDQTYNVNADTLQLALLLKKLTQEG